MTKLETLMVAVFFGLAWAFGLLAIIMAIRDRDNAVLLALGSGMCAVGALVYVLK